MSRHNTIFSLRYAAVVLERHAALWGLANTACRVASLLSGSAAIAALGAQNKELVIVFGLCFALIQALEYGSNPADRSANSRQQSKLYAKVWANEGDYADDDLERAYRAITVDDDITPNRLLKDVSYNQVLSEMGCNTTDAYPTTRWHQVVAFIT